MVRLMLATLVVVSLSCADKPSPEAQIRKVLDEGAAALEAQDAARAAETLSDGYKDPAGQTKDKLKGIAFFALQRGPVLLSMQAVDIKVDGAKAVVTMKVLAIQGRAVVKSAKDLLPSNARSFDITIAMVNDDGWQIASIDGLPRLGVDP